jgi:segregation and condensation protein A
MSEYSVQTDVYSGPMDLLLYLIRREEVDIYDIPVARITGQYCEYVNLLHAIDPNVAGDFLVMAAMLMEIKSRMLLPRQIAEEGETEDLSDPRFELVRQLLQYKTFKDASLQLGSAAVAASQKWPRVPADGPPREVALDLDDVQVWDLVAAFNKLMSAIGAGAATHDVVFDDTPIALHATDILDRLVNDGGELTFDAVFVGRTRAEMIGLFLALLELMRQQRVRISQPGGILGTIAIKLLSAEPITIGKEWEPAIREAVLGVEGAASQEAAESLPVPRPAAPVQLDDAEDEDLAEWEEFAELKKIKTDIDIDAIVDRSKPETE